MVSDTCSLIEPVRLLYKKTLFWHLYNHTVPTSCTFCDVQRDSRRRRLIQRTVVAFVSSVDWEHNYRNSILPCFSGHKMRFKCDFD